MTYNPRSLTRHPTHPDPIVRDLQTIRTLRWSNPDRFTQLGLLLDHPLVSYRATEGRTSQVGALKQILEAVVDQVDTTQDVGTTESKPMRFASRALLRLDPKFANMPVEEIRRAIARKWPKSTKQGNVSSEGFRQHIEVREVYEPLAQQFRSYAQEQSIVTGLSLSSVSNGSSSETSDPGLAELGPIGRRLLELENTAHQKRIRALSEGLARIRNEDEMVEALMTLTQLAQRTMQAVDYISINDWFSSRRVNKYLEQQLARADSVSLERIRLVDDSEIAKPERREQLMEFISRHEQAGAALLLCPVEYARDKGTQFYPRMGLLLVDPDSEPVAVTGWLGEGRTERAMLFTRETEALLELKSDYDILRTGAIEHNRRLREQLHRLDAEH